MNEGLEKEEVENLAGVISTENEKQTSTDSGLNDSVGRRIELSQS